MEENNKKKYILITVFILLIIILIIILSINKNKENNHSNNQENKYSIVNDRTIFFTLEGTVNRYIGLLYTKNNDDLLKVLDDSYIINHEITKDNVIDKIDKIDGVHIFRSKKVYKEVLSDNYTKYYIYGLLKKNEMDEYDYGTDFYLIITIKQDDYTYKVTPYNGEMFKEAN